MHYILPRVHFSNKDIDVNVIKKVKRKRCKHTTPPYCFIYSWQTDILEIIHKYCGNNIQFHISAYCQKSHSNMTTYIKNTTQYLR